MRVLLLNKNLFLLLYHFIKRKTNFSKGGYCRLCGGLAKYKLFVQLNISA